jgi:hypothetical protein
MSKTVTINGRAYDVHTGMPVDSSSAPVKPQKEAAPHTVHPSHAMHQTVQKSQTLNRRIVKKTGPTVSSHTKPNARPDIVRHTAVAKFASHSHGSVMKAPIRKDIAHVPHPIVQNARQKQAVMQMKPAAQPAPKPAAVIKKEAVQESLNAAPSHSAKHEQVRQPKRFPRVLSVASASLALILLGGYFTYLNMPSLSVRVAAAQAGVNASFPSYHPDGYSLNGPVAYTQGQVTMKFASNSGPQNFTVSQSKTSWDSSAVLDNYIKDKAGDNYITYDEHGLTIYTYGGNAAWVNDGVLYTISGDAPLSGDQIRHIATSM